MGEVMEERGTTWTITTLHGLSQVDSPAWDSQGECSLSYQHCEVKTTESLMCCHESLSEDADINMRILEFRSPSPD